MLVSSGNVHPFKTINDKRLSYLLALESSYKELGYPTKLYHRENRLEVYERGAVIPKTEDEIVIERWID
jgi:hypothetical protein